MTDPIQSYIERRVPPVIAYFSMEVGLESDVPTYAGGLGVLAGDTLRAAADLGLPMVGVSLVHRKGYFRQRLDAEGNQNEAPANWSPEARLEALEPRVQLVLEGRTVHVRAWRYRIRGPGEHVVPVYLLDTELPENSPDDRAITDRLYTGDNRQRLLQEAVLGLGGVAILRMLHHNVRVFHLNEGHSALLTLALLESSEAGGAGIEPAADGDVSPVNMSIESRTVTNGVASVRAQCVFTTHTPVPAGHDRFSWDLVESVLGRERASTLARAGGLSNGELNMTQLALHMSRYVNGVAMRHGEISRGMFPGYPIRAITNGVHHGTWTAPAFRALFDWHIPEWRTDPFALRHALGIPPGDILSAHAAAKDALRTEVERRSGVRLELGHLTLGFARRATPYKRGALLFSDIERLRRISREIGPLQVVYAGKAHPRDMAGKAVIRDVFAAGAALRGDVAVAYLEEYDMALAALVIAGVDVWLNTPQRPQEASGTSGMKAALNGVPSLSVLDGWWIEGHIEGVTGWAIGEGVQLSDDEAAQDASALYDKLEQVIAPLYYRQPDAFAQVMRSAIALNGSFFNSPRMLLQYAAGAYGRAVPGPVSSSVLAHPEMQPVSAG